MKVFIPILNMLSPLFATSARNNKIKKTKPYTEEITET